MRFAAMNRVRRASMVAAVGAGLLSATACGYITPQETTRIQTVTDGISANVGPLQLRNMLIVSTGENKPGRVVGGVFNSSSKDVSLTIDGASGSQTTIPVKANSQTLLTGESNPAVLSTSGGNAGSLVPLKVTESGTNQTAEVKVPVLDGTLKEYQQYLPTQSPTPTSSTTGTASPSGTATSGATSGATSTATPSATSSAASHG